MHKHNDSVSKRVLWRRNKSEATVCGYRIDACVVDLEARAGNELSYDGLKLYEVDGVAYHGDPDGRPSDVGNVYTGITNERALAKTRRRRECLQLCVGEENVTAYTDRDVQAMLDADPTAASESRLEHARARA